MAEQNPTVIIAHLDDEKLRKSIDSLVGYVDEKFKAMTTSTTNAVNTMQNELQKLGSLNAKGVGGAGGGELGITKALQRAKQEAKESSMTFDQMAASMQKATTGNGNKTIFSTMDTEISILKERLVEAKSQVESFTVMARRGAETGDKGLFTFSTENLHKYEAEVEKLTQQINSLTSQRQALKEMLNPQGDAFKNYVDSLTKANPELAALNAQYKRGESLLNSQTSAVRKRNEEEQEGIRSEKERAAAQARYSQQLREAHEQEKVSQKERAVAAMETAKALRDAMKAQKDDNIANNTQQSIAGVRELHDVINQMHRTYLKMSEEEKASPIGKSLQQDILLSRQALQEYEKYNRALLGMASRDPIANRDKVDSYTMLSNRVRQLTKEYQSMTTAERDSAKGKGVAEKIQLFSRALSEIQKQMNRPTSLKNALGLDENTLDRIAYKIQQLNAYRAGLNITDQKQVGEMRTVETEIDRLKKKQDELMGKNQQLMNSNNALGRSWNYMKNRLAFYFTVGASTQFVKQLIDIRGQYELLERSIGILIDSAQNGSRIFAELNSMALKSPFTTMELGAAAKQLVAYDVAAKDVVDTTKRLADIAAAVGVPIERLTYALGQIKSYNYLNARDARMFANTGIPLVKELADMYTKLEGQLVSTADVYDRIKKKAVSYEDVMRVVNEMTDEGGKFFNFQEKAADTLKVKIANLALVYNNMLNEIGKDQNGVLRGLLGGTKTLMENWRSIYNSLLAIVTVLGVAKAIQLVIVLQQKNMTTYMAVQKVLGEGIAKSLLNIKNAYAALFSMSGVLTAGLTALAFTLAKLSYDYYDLVKENEAFNDSIVKGAEENIKSIEKFLEDYRNELANIAGADKSDQQKMWEKVQDEIETTIKNAKQYLDVLNEIEDVAERIQTGKAILQQQEEIEQAAKDLASKHLFDMGGGFADESLAKNLREYDDLLNTLINDYGSVEEARKRWETKDFGFGNIWQNYRASLVETRNELDNFVSKLDQVNLAKVMGSGDAQTQYANIRNFATIIRDAFLATEEGSKVGAEGQARLNAALDEWITKQGVANNLIKEREINGHKYTAAQIANIEQERTAWEMFFDRISSKDKETLDYAIDTNQTGSREVKDIWDKATKEMKENERTAYEQIESHIKVLRDTPDIVLNIIYRESYEKSTDKQVREYTDKYLTPSGTGVLTPTEYARQKNELTKKYGKFIKKEGEDNVEWEKRLGQTYQDNKKSIESLNAQLKNSANLSEIDKAAKEDELKTLKDQQTVLEQIGKDQNFNYDQSEKGRKKGGGTKKDELGEALSKEVQYINEIQKRFKEYQKDGANAQEALIKSSNDFGKSIQQNNAILQKYGFKTLSSEQLATMPLQEVRDFYQEQLKGANLSAKGVEALEKAIANLNVEITKVDYKRITDGLNNELSRIKDEYELAVELDANPELGNLFADWMGIDTNELPRTFQEVVRKAQQGIDKVFAENNRTDKIDIASMLNKESFDKWVKDSGLAIDSELVKAVEQFRQYLHKTQVDENKKMTDEWSKLVEKYGDLQAKILKIYKDSLQEQIGIVRKFGDSGEVQEALDLSKKINFSQDPAEIARLQEQLANIIKSVVARNPQALDISTAVENKGKSETAKAYWEDFKNSELYTMTFEDMANNSTRAIQLIIDKLNELKFKVKEDPASMKALIKSLNEAESELNVRDPFGGIIKSIKAMSEASRDAKKAKKELAQADVDVSNAQEAVDYEKQNGNARSLYEAEQQLTNATNRRTTAQKNLTDAENKGKKAEKSLKESVDATVDVFNNISKAVDGAAEVFRIFGDNDTADAISEINKGFSAMTTLIMGVFVALMLLKTTNPWLLAISAALGVIVGLVSFLSGNSNKKITKQVEESERHVKALEISYQDLQDAMEDAYGYGEVAAKRATITNKELQLVELQRQLQLEKSRKKKNQDANRIMELQSAIINLRNELDGSTKDIVNDLLGISSVGDAAEQLVSSMIDAFKNGEDYMKVYEDSFEDMIDNLIMKAIVGEIVGRKVQQMFDAVEKESTKRADKTAYSAKMPSTRDMLEELYPDYGITEKNIRDYNNIYFNRIREAKTFEEVLSAYEKSQADALQRGEQNFYDMLQKQKEFVLSEYADAATIRPEDLRVLTPEWKESWMDGVQDLFTGTMDTLGITFGQGAEKSLSNLQQGLQSMSEETGSALEAYMNGVSQQCYLQSDLLTQIRDAVVAIDSDVQIATNAQILLQLQQSYAVQMAIQSILMGWSTPSGMAVRVELNS